MTEMVSYRFKGGNIRFRQYAKDPLPKWAMDVRAEPMEPVKAFDLAEKVSDLVRDAFYEACETMQTWNGTLGPMSQDELHAAWMESEARKQLLAWAQPPFMAWTEQHEEAATAALKAVSAAIPDMPDDVWANVDAALGKDGAA